MNDLSPAPGPCSASPQFEARADQAEQPAVFLMTNSFETGGSERQFRALAECLDRKSYRVELGCIMARGAFREGLGAVAEFRLYGSLYNRQSWQTRWALCRHLRRQRIAIAHAFDFYTNLILVPAAKFARVPIIIGSQRQLGDLLTPAKAHAQRMIFRWCDAVVANSKAAAAGLVARGLAQERVVVIPNGLPPSAFELPAPALPRAEGMVRAVMVARMNTWSKNHRLLLRAAARLRDRLPQLEWLLAGDGPLRPELEREAAQLGVADRIRFLGERRDIPAVLAAADISVLPSASESLSNAILESMAAGLPVVASNVGGNPELVAHDSGELVAPDREGELATSVERLVTDPARRKAMGRRARELAVAEFTVERMRERHEELYRRLLEKKNWRPARVFPRPALPGQGRRRVALVAASLRYVGGQSVQAELLLKNWRDDLEIEVQFIPIDPPLPRLVGWVERVPGLRTLVREPFYVRGLWRGVRSADVVHIFSASYSSFWVAPAVAWVVARLRGKKTLIHYHSGEARDHLGKSPTARWLLGRAHALVVPSGYLVDVFREFGLEAVAVPNIVDLAQFRFRRRSPLRPHLVCTRGFHPYYAVDVVVRAFAEISKVFPDATLDLVGGGPMEEEIRALVQSENLTGVRFCGVAPYSTIARFYDRADIFVNASWLDNMPVSVLEAFAAGTPVVTTAPESMRYLVDHERTGLLSTPGDPHELAENVLRVLHDPSLAERLADQAYQESRRVEWKVVREQWLDVYRNTLADHQEPARAVSRAVGDPGA